MAKSAAVLVALLILLSVLAPSAGAQTPQSAGPPQLVAYNGTVLGADGQPRTGTIALTFSLYQDQDGNVPIWQEAQSVLLNDRGQYYVWLGHQASLPAEAFQKGQPQWLGVTPAGLQEQPRVKLLSVPYALKAGDAETLGGLPASAFLRSATAADGKDAQHGGQPAAGGFVAPLDNVIADNLIVQGKVCIGSNLCANGEVFGFEELKVKQNFDPTIKWEQTNMTFPASWFATGNDINWVLNENGNITLGPLRVEHSAPNSSLVVDTTGSIGIGTDTPIQKLDILGTGSTYAQVKATFGGNGGLHLVSGATCPMVNPLCNDVVLKNNAADNAFTIDNPNGAEHFRITADGKVGINTPAPFHVVTATAAASAYVNLISLGGNAGHIFTAGSREAVIRLNIADGSFVWENPNGTERMRINPNGNVGIGTTNPTQPLMMGSGAYVSGGGVWTDASSRTFKDEIATLSLAAARDAFAKLQPVTFIYKASPTEKHVGFIAEDVPDLVARADRKSLATMDIVGVMTKVVQGQQTTIDDLKTTIDDLKARLTKLEALLEKQQK